MLRTIVLPIVVQPPHPNSATHAQKPLQVIKALTGTTEEDACGHL